MRNFHLTSPFSYPALVLPLAMPPPDRVVEDREALFKILNARHGERVLMLSHNTIFEFVSEARAGVISGVVDPQVVAMADGQKGQWWMTMEPSPRHSLRALPEWHVSWRSP